MKFLDKRNIIIYSKAGNHEENTSRLRINIYLFVVLLFLADKTIFVSSWSISDSSPTTPFGGSRRVLLQRTTSAVLGGGLVVLSSPPSTFALVKGNAPPVKKKEISQKLTCTNVEECEEQRDRLQQQQIETAVGESITPLRVTSSGTRFKDLREGDGDQVVEVGDVAAIRYKVLKIGKRSSDGLSGEGTVVFSKGYGLEDNEQAGGEFLFTVDESSNVISALLDGIVGIREGGVRRISVMPQKGWEKASPQCDGGPGGRGAGGDIKTDYVLVPTATMVATEICFDKTKLPFPTNSYAEQRRMAQRFDQTLILEVELLRVQKKTKLS